MSKPESDNSQINVDRLSELPEALLLHILSFVLTKFAIRTSVVSRRFRSLWTASPSVDLDCHDFPQVESSQTQPSAVSASVTVLPHLSVSVSTHTVPVSILLSKTALNWLNHAYSLGPCDLYLDIYTDNSESLFPLILTFHSLEFLKISSLDLNDSFLYSRSFQPLIPSNFLATGLRSLQLKAKVSCSDLKRVIMEQTNLEDLCLEPPRDTANDIVSRTVKKMKLISAGPEVNLFLPALEVRDLTIGIYPTLEKFHAEMPLLRKADLKLQWLSEESVPVLDDMLRCFINVSQLSIHIENAYPREPEQLPGLRRAQRRKCLEKHQFHMLAEPGKDLLTFPHLRSLKLLMHFHDDGTSDLIFFLQNSPVLESVELDHVDYDYMTVKGGWKSKLPQDSKGNNQHAYFSELHKGDRKIELIRLLCNGRRQKKLKI